MAFRIPKIVEQGSQYRCSGETPIDETRTLKVSDLDGTDTPIALHKFGPDEGHLWFLALEVGELDGGVALVYDVVLVDDDGTVVTTLSSGSTTGQAGGYEIVRDFGTASVPPETADLYLAIDVTTPAGTPQAGNIRVLARATSNI